MTKQIVPINVYQKNTKKEKKYTPILKLRKGKLDIYLYDTQVLFDLIEIKKIKNIFPLFFRIYKWSVISSEKLLEDTSKQ